MNTCNKIVFLVTLPKVLSITSNTKKTTINICPVALPSVSLGRDGKISNGFW